MTTEIDINWGVLRCARTQPIELGTRYAPTFMPAIAFAAIVIFWLNQ
jgi:hypothetical protein